MRAIITDLVDIYANKNKTLNSIAAKYNTNLLFMLKGLVTFGSFSDYKLRILERSMGELWHKHVDVVNDRDRVVAEKEALKLELELVRKSLQASLLDDTSK